MDLENNRGGGVFTPSSTRTHVEEHPRLWVHREGFAAQETDLETWKVCRRINVSKSTEGGESMGVSWHLLSLELLKHKLGEYYSAIIKPSTQSIICHI